MGYINDQEWKGYNTNLKDLNEVTLKDFEFKFNNRILVTKTFLHKIRKVNVKLYSSCKRNQKQFYIYLLNAIKSKYLTISTYMVDAKCKFKY